MVRATGCRRHRDWLKILIRLSSVGGVVPGAGMTCTSAIMDQYAVKQTTYSRITAHVDKYRIDDEPSWLFRDIAIENE